MFWYNSSKKMQINVDTSKSSWKMELKYVYYSIKIFGICDECFLIYAFSMNWEDPSHAWISEFLLTPFS